MHKSRSFSGPRARKELGQHFLLDEEIAAQIVSAAQLAWDDRALEIGPGRGVLLRFLLKACRQVTAVELDTRLKKSLEKTFGGHPGLDLIFGDFLNFDLEAYLRRELAPVKIIGNIPYSLSSVILFRLFDIARSGPVQGGSSLKSATLMLQREVAQRVCAEPGSRAYGAVTVMRSLVADAILLFSVPPGAFHPAPRVTSAVVRLDFYPSPRFSTTEHALFSSFIHHVFMQRRKMLKKTVGSFIRLKANWQQVDFDFSKRPEEISLEDFTRLFHLVVPSE